MILTFQYAECLENVPMENVGPARQAAAVWSKIQQTRERRALGYGLSYTAKKVNVFEDYLHSTTNSKDARSNYL